MAVRELLDFMIKYSVVLLLALVTVILGQIVGNSLYSVLGLIATLMFGLPVQRWQYNRIELSVIHDDAYWRERENRVMEIREKLSEVAQNLLPLVNQKNPNKLEVEKLFIQLSEHLGNVAEFCDETSKEWIENILRLTFPLAENWSKLSQKPYTMLKWLLPQIVGIQVDFNKRPFKVITFKLDNSKGNTPQ